MLPRPNRDACCRMLSVGDLSFWIFLVELCLSVHLPFLLDFLFLCQSVQCGYLARYVFSANEYVVTLSLAVCGSSVHLI